MHMWKMAHMGRGASLGSMGSRESSPVVGLHYYTKGDPGPWQHRSLPCSCCTPAFRHLITAQGGMFDVDAWRGLLRSPFWRRGKSPR